MSDEDKERQRRMMELVPSEWDKKPLLLASEIREFLKSVGDEGTSIDSGGGDGFSDLWVTVQGIEYHITVAKSHAQLAREGADHERS